MAKSNDLFTTIAREEMGVATLEPRNRDSLDFHDLSVRSIRAALERAYDAGRKHAPPTRCSCPACGRDIEIRSI